VNRTGVVRILRTDPDTEFDLGMDEMIVNVESHDGTLWVYVAREVVSDDPVRGSLAG
jgi:hypothetical protein